MFTSFMDAILCCLTGKSANAVGPLETSEPVGGFEFVEVKPGRVLRVLHIVPDRPMVEEMTAGDGASVSCKRRITVFRNGQLLIENNGDSSAEAEPPDGCEPPAVPAMSERQQRTWGKAKHTVLIDHERTVTCCKETHPDVALYFIHGVGGSLDMWSRQLDYFSQLGYEVIALDLAGHGASSAPRVTAAYTFYALAEDIRIIFQTYKKQRNILIGHSYGLFYWDPMDITNLNHVCFSQGWLCQSGERGKETSKREKCLQCVLFCAAIYDEWTVLARGG
uniref:AB hydrolase-1 domain-containing protein n=1 Tax=Electrophorus electricus TaxID=8005 RepID=A0A4W4G0Z2_ELEEL